jgi:uncharacterized delta-60 repeat protein
MLTNVFAGTDDNVQKGLPTSDCKLMFGLSYFGTRFGLIRLNLDGTLDTTFNGSGMYTLAGGGGTQAGSESATSFIIQPDEKILLVSNSGNDLRMIRVNKNGTVDTTFGAAGIVTQDLGGIDQAYDVGLQSNGKILLTGRKDANLFVSRFTSLGVLDTTFATAGTYQVGALGYGTRMIVLSNDQFLVLGSVAATDFNVLKFYENGATDTTFGTAGVATADVGVTDYSYGMEVLSSGKIIVGGADGANNHAAVRFTSNGFLDTTYGTAGKAILNEPLGIYSQYQFSVMALLPSEQIIIGNTSSTTQQVNFAKFNADGSVDTTFGTAGRLTLNGTGMGTFLRGPAGILAQPDGKVVLGVAIFNGNSGYTRYQ